MMTHNRHCDTVRAISKASAFPTTLSPAELDRAFALASQARHMLAQAYAILKPDHSLMIRAETAGKCAKDLMESTVARMPAP